MNIRLFEPIVWLYIYAIIPIQLAWIASECYNKRYLDLNLEFLIVYDLRVSAPTATTDWRMRTQKFALVNGILLWFISISILQESKIIVYRYSKKLLSWKQSGLSTHYLSVNIELLENMTTMFMVIVF